MTHDNSPESILDQRPGQAQSKAKVLGYKLEWKEVQNKSFIQCIQ